MEAQNENYQPGTDQNQGIVGEMAHAQQVSNLDPREVGVSQEPQFDPNVDTNAEVAKEELGADAANEDLLTEETVADDDDTVEGNDEEQASFDGPDF